MQGDNYKKRRVVILEMNLLLIFWDILNGFRGRFSIGIAQVDIFEA